MTIDLDDLATLHYEIRDPGDNGIAVVTLDRPESRNAQNKRMTYEMNAAFDDASRRTDVKVIVLFGAGVVVGSLFPWFRRKKKVDASITGD